MQVRVAESIDAPGPSPYVRLAIAVLAQAAKDWSIGDGEDYEEADRFFFANGVVFGGRKLAKEHMEYPDFTIEPGERYSEEPVFETRQAIRLHWFNQAGIRLPEPATLRSILLRYRMAPRTPRGRHAGEKPGIPRDRRKTDFFDGL